MSERKMKENTDLNKKQHSAQYTSYPTLYAILFLCFFYIELVLSAGHAIPFVAINLES